MLLVMETRRENRRRESYAIYVHEVLKQVHPDTGISSNQQGDEHHHEQLRERHLRAHLGRVVLTGALQPSLDDREPRDPDGRSSTASWRVDQARRQRGHEGCHQVHVVQVDCTSGRQQPALFRATHFLVTKATYLNGCYYKYNFSSLETFFLCTVK